jgi:[acyl-carrier-protein] S-malonyltransferase
VGGAFHTPLMQEAATAFEADLEDATFSPSSVPVVSNGDAQAHQDGPGWRRRLVDHLVSPVRWRESVETLVTLGATDLVEVGPGTTLGGLAKRTAPGLYVHSVESSFQEVGV